MNHSPPVTRRLATLLALMLISQAAGRLQAADPVANQPDWNSLSADEVQQSFQLLRHNLSNGNSALSQEALNRAALRGILEQGQTGAVIVSKAQQEKENQPAPPFYATLSGSAVYARPNPLLPENLAALRDFLSAQPPEIQTLVLDLRQASPPRPLAPAADFLSLFLPDKTSLFTPASQTTVLSTKGPPCWNRRLWLLVDSETPNDLELAALVLSRQPGVLTIGSPTSGQAVEFAEKPLGSGHLLRIASASPLLADGSPAASQLVIPKFVIAPQLEQKRHLFSLTDPAALLPALSENDRPHRNEAALMAGTDPELAARLAPAAAAASAILPDPVLQQTLDLLKTSLFLHLDPPEPSSPRPTAPAAPSPPAGHPGVK